MQTDELNARIHLAVQAVLPHHSGMLSPYNESPKLLWLQNYWPSLVADAVSYDMSNWLAATLMRRRNVR